MPPPNRRHDPSPEELARQIADQLARSKPATPRFSLRNSVLAGRLIAGVTALASIALVVAGVVAGVSWLLARTTEPQPEVLANTVELADDGADAVADDTTTTRLDGTLPPLVPLMFPTPLSDTTGTVGEQPGPTTVTIPPASTSTTASSTTTTSNSVASTSTPTTTTQPPTTTTLPATTTTALPTTTTTIPTTTTTLPATTTTTIPSTTTTEVTTTTRPSPPSTPGQGG